MNKLNFKIGDEVKNKTYYKGITFKVVGETENFYELQRKGYVRRSYIMSVVALKNNDSWMKV